MQPTKPLRSFPLASAGLAPALVALLLAAADPRLAAQTVSDNLNSASGSGASALTGWTAYGLLD